VRLTIGLLVLSTFAAAQSFDLKGDVPTPKTFSAADLQKLPRNSATVQVSGTKVKYEGVSLVDLFKAAGLLFDEATKPTNLIRYVVVQGTDKYRVVFAVPEFDPSLTNKLVILADTKDGKPLSSAEGPFHVIVADEKRQMRWVKFAESMTVVRVP